MIKYKDAHGNIIVITDESHLFVTKDRLGKDVFAGDKIKSWYPCGQLIADDLIVKHLCPAAFNGYNFANMNDIELIEDKNNE